MVDTGVGTGNQFIEDLYSPQTVALDHALHEVGVDERDVVGVVNTHLHFDHCGQNAVLPGVPAWVQDAETQAAATSAYTVLEWADLASERLTRVDGDIEIAAGVTLLATPGHTPGHQSVLVESRQGRRSLIVGQCSYNCAEYRLGEVVPTDMYDAAWLEVGRESLTRLRSLDVDEAWFSHDPTVYRRKS